MTRRGVDKSWAVVLECGADCVKGVFGIFDASMPGERPAPAPFPKPINAVDGIVLIESVRSAAAAAAVELISPVDGAHISKTCCVLCALCWTITTAKIDYCMGIVILG